MTYGGIRNTVVHGAERSGSGSCGEGAPHPRHVVIRAAIFTRAYRQHARLEGYVTIDDGLLN